MSSSFVEVDGADELARLLRQIGDKDLKRANRLAYKRAAEIVADKARAGSPVRSGRLRSSVRPLGTQRGGAVRANAPYASTIQWGRQMGNVGSPPGNRRGRNVVRPQPFMTDALAESREEVVAVYEDEVMRLFDLIRGTHGE